jgi:acyl-CoA-binding protein
MTGKAPNGDNPNMHGSLRKIDQRYPKKSQQQNAGAIATEASVNKDAIEVQRAQKQIEADAHKEHKTRERERARYEAINDLKGKTRKDYIGREHFIAIAHTFVTKEQETPFDPVKLASEAFNKIVSAQYNSYLDKTTHRVIKQSETEEAKGPIGVALARRDEVGLGIVDPALSSSGSVIANEHAIRINDFLDFVDEYGDPEKPLPIDGNIGAKSRQVLTMISGFVESNIVQEDQSA